MPCSILWYFPSLVYGVLSGPGYWPGPISNTGPLSTPYTRKGKQLPQARYQTLTNHSVRATAITNLFRQGLPTSTIMGVSRHRSAASLSSYNQPTEAEKLKRAALLDLDLPKKSFVKGMKKTKMLRRLTRFCHKPQHQS